MGGNITVHSELNRGADFVFYIKSAKARYVEIKKTSRGRLRPPKLASRAIGFSPASSRSSFSTVASGLGSPELPSSQLDGAGLPSLGSALEKTPPETTTPTHRDRLRVLVAEDNLLNQKLLQRQIAKAGIDVKVANNGLEAIDRLKKAATDGVRINVCLMDLECV